MDVKKYNVTFIGKDYTSIPDVSKIIDIKDDEGNKYIIDNNGNIVLLESDEINSDSVVSKRLLNLFLNQVAPAGKVKGDLIVNKSSEKSVKKNDDRDRLYEIKSENPDGTMDVKFQGVVGVINHIIECNSKELTSNRKEKSSGDMPQESEEVSEEKEEISGPDYRLNINLKIQSRLDDQKPYFLSTMLLRGKLNLTNRSVPASEDDLFDYLLLFWFKDQLTEACLKGYFRSYRRFERNDDRLRGSIDVARHIRLNMGQNNGRIAYSYRENTVNNYLNHMIVAAYDTLKKKYYDLVSDNFDSNHELKGVIDFLRTEIGYYGSNAIELINKNAKVIAHPYYTEYEQLRKTCIKILRNEGISFFDGEDDSNTRGVLFYIPDLWELFIEDKLNEYIKNEYKCIAQAKVMNFGYTDSDDDNKVKYCKETFPDYVFFKRIKESLPFGEPIFDEPFMILDAKFKPSWEAVYKDNAIDLEDYTKCLRDMVAINAHASGVIFPTHENVTFDDRILKHRISKFNDIDTFYAFPISVPMVESMDYNEWKAKFEKNIERSMTDTTNGIGTIVEREYKFYDSIKELAINMKSLRNGEND